MSNTQSTYPKGPAIRIATPAVDTSPTTSPVRVERSTGEHVYRDSGNIDKTLKGVKTGYEDDRSKHGPNNTLTTPNTGRNR